MNNERAKRCYKPPSRLPERAGSVLFNPPSPSKGPFRGSLGSRSDLLQAGRCHRLAAVSPQSAPDAVLLEETTHGPPLGTTLPSARGGAQGAGGGAPGRGRGGNGTAHFPSDNQRPARRFSRPGTELTWGFSRAASWSLSFLICKAAPRAPARVSPLVRACPLPKDRGFHSRPGHLARLRVRSPFGDATD